MKTQLYSFWRSSASFRVRIALHLKGVEHEIIPIHLLKNGGEHTSNEYADKNPNCLIPLLIDGEHAIHQSLAIIEYLEETYPNPPLLPKKPIDRAWVRALAMDIAIDIHPISNLRVLRYLMKKLGVSAQDKDTWSRHWILLGLESLEKQLSKASPMYRFACGDQPGLVDICLVPQIFNALSAGIDMTHYPRLKTIYQECMTLPAFIEAAWENQIDAEGLNPSIEPKD